MSKPMIDVFEDVTTNHPNMKEMLIIVWDENGTTIHYSNESRVVNRGMLEEALDLFRNNQ
jgi:hypothetical protein